MLTFAEMERVIQSGGSVLYSGQIITRVEGLPSEADLAQTEEERAAVAGGLEKQVADLRKQIDKLKQPAKKGQADESEPPTGGHHKK